MSLFKRLTTFINNHAHLMFIIGIIFKGIDGLLELCGGAALCMMSLASISRLASFLASDELAEEPGNLIANYTVHLGNHLTLRTKTFAAIYLLVHGTVKVALVGAMFKRIKIAYPTAAIVILAFVGYQCFRLSERFSILLTVLSAIDVAIVALILREYAGIRGKHRAGRSRSLIL